MGHLPFRNLLSFSLHISENYGNNLIVRMEGKNVSVSYGEVIDNLIKKKDVFFLLLRCLDNRPKLAEYERQCEKCELLNKHIHLEKHNPLDLK